MTVVDRSLIPTVADAERAAKVVADAGAGSVLLFGSVARGEAHHQSDIDLMVIFDDIDYECRHNLAYDLKDLASAEAGCRVDIHLTDRPEWKVRTEQVITSFESRVKGHAVVVVDKAPGDVDWDKEMVMPTSDYEEAVERLGQLANALGGIESALVPTFSQQFWDQDGDEIAGYVEYQTRLARGCAAGHLVVETALKSLIHLSSSPEAKAWGHDLRKLLDQLPDPHRGEIESLLAPLSIENLQGWQEQARYQRFVTPTPELFTAIAETACEVAVYTAAQFEQGPDIAETVRRHVSIIEKEMARRDLYTGEQM